MKVFYPDALYNLHKLSGAVFLYFDEPLNITLHPSVSTSLTGVDAFAFNDVVRSKSPIWESQYAQFMDFWSLFRTSLTATQNVINPLIQNGIIKPIWLSYNKGSNGWAFAKKYYSGKNISKELFYSKIDRYHAADELYSHLFYEMVLKNLLQQNVDMSSIHKGIVPSYNENGDKIQWNAIYDYCDHLFTENSLEDLLCISYLFRLSVLPVFHNNSILLSNEGVFSILNSLDESFQRPKENEESQNVTDIISWEFFRQILSQYVDPLNEESIKKVITLKLERKDELTRFKNKCYSLAEGINRDSDALNLKDEVKNHIKANVANELQDLLKLDKRLFSNYLEELFSDPKTWAGVLSVIASLFTHEPIITASSAILTASNSGAKFVKASADKRHKIIDSPYSFIYRISRE